MSDEFRERCTIGILDADEGNEQAYWQLTRKELCDPVNWYIDRRPVIPVLFLPGIMGTNLKNITIGKNAWAPPNNIFSGLATFLSYRGKSAEVRAAELDPLTTEVDATGTVDSAPLRESPAAQRKRHWGEIYSASYHRFMATLQFRLNAIHAAHSINGQRPLLDVWNRLLDYDIQCLGYPDGNGKGTKPQLRKDQVEHLHNFRFEVWAGGYNWLRSNADSARDIGKRIDHILAAYGKKGKLAVKKVLLVTHSMGGLVARALLCPGETDYSDKILGIIHGAMPANGAAETYVSMRRGIAGLQGIVVGKDAEQIGAVMARAAGGMELLPFGTRYEPEDIKNDKRIPVSTWLYYAGGLLSENTPDWRALPQQGRVYEDIYKARQWYGLLPDGNLRKLPWAGGGEDQELAVAREAFEKLIEKTKKFHNAISARYHKNTFAFWGCDEDRKAMSRVVWKPKPDRRPPADGAPVDDGKGAMYDGAMWHELSPFKEAGDGTVPYTSWRTDVFLPRLSFIHGKTFAPGRTGWEHQNAFNDDRALYVAMYGIARLVAEQVPVPGN
jgi:hypothetical protein